METNHKKTFTLTIVVIILSAILITTVIVMKGRNKEIVGNTDEDVLNYVNSSNLMDSIGKEDLSIVDTVCMENSKIVGFKSSTGHGYAVYEKNKQGDFIMTDSAAQGISDKGLRASDFVVSYNVSNGLENSEKAYISISEDKNIAEVAMTVNERTFITPFDTGKPSMVVMADVIPMAGHTNEITYKCTYLDQNGKELSQ